MRFDQTIKQFQEEEKALERKQPKAKSKAEKSLEVTQKVSVIKVGHKLVVTIPAKWARLTGINKGDKLVLTLCKEDSTS